MRPDRRIFTLQTDRLPSAAQFSGRLPQSQSIVPKASLSVLNGNLILAAAQKYPKVATRLPANYLTETATYTAVRGTFPASATTRQSGQSDANADASNTSCEMKTKRNLIQICLLATALLLPAVAQAQFTFYTINGAITITGYTGASGNVTIPSTINGYPVTTIAFAAFYTNSTLTSLTIPNSVTNIGASACWECPNLGSITLPGTIAGIGDYAFFNCPSLTNATISFGVANLGNGMFDECSSLTSITIPASVTTIGVNAFRSSGLASVTIPGSVTNIGTEAFQDCLNLTNATFASGANTIADYAFSGCSNLHQAYFQGNAPSVNGGSGSTDNTVFYGESGTVYYLPGTTGWGTTFGGWPTAVLSVPVSDFTYITNNGAITITGYMGTNGNVIIPGTINGWPVTAIGPNAFFDDSLTSVTIGANVTTIGDYAFGGCNLTNVIIPNSVLTIGYSAFFACDLTSVTIPGSVTNIGQWAFENCPLLNAAYFEGNAPTVGGGPGSADYTVFVDNYGPVFEQGTVYYLPGTTGWGSNFGGWPTAVLSVPVVDFTYTTNNGAITITGYSGPSDMIIPSSINGYPVTTIGYRAFLYQSFLSSVTIPNSVTNIAEEAFYDCSGLTSLTFPNSVISIGNNAFGECSGLTNLTIPNSVNSIGYLAFSYCSGLTGVTIPNSVTNLGNDVFAECTGLKSVTIPNRISSIGAYVFFDCSNLTSVTIPNSVASIGDLAFSYAGLKSVTIPNSVTRIGNYAFEACPALTNATIANGVTNLGVYVFGYCFNLHQAYFQGNAPSVNGGAGSVDNTLFSGESGTVYYLPGTTGWGSNFGGWPTAVQGSPVSDFTFTTNNGAITITGYTGSGGNVTIPSTINGYPVTAIGTLAFYYQTTVTGVIIPGSVTSIGFEAFYWCSGLTNVTIGNSVTNIGYNAFEFCSSLHQAYFQGNAPSVNGGAGSADSSVFAGESGTAYYVPGTTGWGSTFGGWPTAVLGGGSPVADFTYTTNNGAITITGYTGPGGNVTIPSTINGYPVTTIGVFAFFNQTAVTNVIISNSVTTIGECAFRSSGLFSVTIPGSVTNIWPEAFQECLNMTYATFANGATTVGQSTFYGCSNLTTVTIPATVSTIGASVFAYCTSLTNIVIPASVTNIDTQVYDGAFWGCDNLIAISVDPSNSSYASLDGVLFDKSMTTLIEYPAGLEGNYTIPNGVLSIGDYAFVICMNLTGAVIPSSVHNIGGFAFDSCANLHQVYFQGNAPSVNGGAGSADTSVFWGDLGTVYYEPGTTGWGATFGGWPTAVLGSPVVDFTYTTNNGAITITGYTGPGGIVSIPSTINGYPVTTIGNGAFYYQATVTGVIIPNSVNNIDNSAFGLCSGLTSVTIPNSVTSIGGFAFDSCTNLHQAYFQGSAPSVNGGAGSADTSVFWGDLGTVYYEPGTTGWGATFGGWPTAVLSSPIVDFTYTTNNGAITITGYTGPSGIVSIPSTINGYPVTSIGYEAFFYYTDLSSVAIPNSVTNIGDDAFCNCSSLTDVTIPNSITSIGYGVFADCSCLSRVTIPNSVTSIGIDAFAADANLTSITIPNSVTNIGEYAFQRCFNLTNVTIGTNVTSIGSWAFYRCFNLNNVTIPNNVTNVGEAAFGDCYSLTAIKVDMRNSAYSSMDGVLLNHDRTTLVEYPGGITGNYTIPNCVTTIGRSAFAECTSLTSVTIPNSVTSIGNYAFQLCTSLTSVTIGINITNVGASAFAYCNSLTRVYFQGNAPSLGSDVFDYPISEIFGGIINTYYVFDPATVYYLPGTTGWGPTFGGCPTALWFLPNPTILNFEPNFGVQANGFGFTISWATNVPVAVEACTNLANPVWTPVTTNALVNGTYYFSDPQWTNYPGRFYRLRSP